MSPVELSCCEPPCLHLLMETPTRTINTVAQEKWSIAGRWPLSTEGTQRSVILVLHNNCLWLSLAIRTVVRSACTLQGNYDFFSDEIFILFIYTNLAVEMNVLTFSAFT